MSEEDIQPEPEQKSEEAFIPWRQFLEEYPLNSVQKVSEYYRKTDEQYDPHRRNAPILRLWCPDQNCRGVRNFAGEWQHYPSVRDTKVYHDFLVYRCRDCGEAEKTFCVASQAIDNDGNGCAVKIGEFPEAHIDIPSSLPKLMGEDYPTFVKGLKCEKQGFGIGSFSYYRRVVENQKGRLIAKIIEAAQRLSAKPEAVKTLEAASQEDQFSKAIDMMKGSIPESLLVDGHNPLKLVHKALSMGLHAETDEKCLEIAHSIRMVLSDLADRIKQALREQAELRSAISSLMQFQSERGQETSNKAMDSDEE